MIAKCTYLPSALGANVDVVKPRPITLEAAYLWVACKPTGQTSGFAANAKIYGTTTNMIGFALPTHTAIMTTAAVCDVDDNWTKLSRYLSDHRF